MNLSTSNSDFWDTDWILTTVFAVWKIHLGYTNLSLFFINRMLKIHCKFYFDSETSNDNSFLKNFPPKIISLFIGWYCISDRSSPDVMVSSVCWKHYLDIELRKL